MSYSGNMERRRAANSKSAQNFCTWLNEKYGGHFTATPCEYGTSLTLTGRETWETPGGRNAANKALRDAARALVAEENLPDTYGLCGKGGFRSTMLVPVRVFNDYNIPSATTEADTGKPSPKPRTR